jgi:hypothetical protein
MLKRINKYISVDYEDEENEKIMNLSKGKAINHESVEQKDIGYNLSNLVSMFNFVIFVIRTYIVNKIINSTLSQQNIKRNSNKLQLLKYNMLGRLKNSLSQRD